MPEALFTPWQEWLANKEWVTQLLRRDLDRHPAAPVQLSARLRKSFPILSFSAGEESARSRGLKSGTAAAPTPRVSAGSHGLSTCNASTKTWWLPRRSGAPSTIARRTRTKHDRDHSTAKTQWRVAVRARGGGGDRAGERQSAEEKVGLASERNLKFAFG